MTPPSSGPTAPPLPIPGITAIDLLLELGEVSDALSRCAHLGEWLDAFLLSATLLSGIDDHLHWSSSPPSRVASYLEGGDAGFPMSVAATAATTVHRAGAMWRAGSPTGARLEAVRDDLVGLTVDLAVAVTMNTVLDPDGTQGRQLAARSDAIRDGRPQWPAPVTVAPARIPSCFRSFDQQPADVAELARRFADQHPERDRHVLVGGVRTSGVHLGALVVAELRALGYASVDLLPARPSERLDAGQRRTLDRSARDGLALVIDDPPSSGGSIAGVARALEEYGFTRERIILLLATEHDATSLPPSLERWPRVILPWADWAVHLQLDRDAVAATVERLLPDGEQLLDLVAVPSPVPVGPGCLAPTRREHQRSAFTATISSNGVDHRATIVVERTGVGFYGRHAVEVATALGDLVPDVLGWEDGVLYQLIAAADDQPDGVPDRHRRGRHPGEQAVGDPADLIAGYVAARRKTLPLARDLSPQLHGRQAVWEVAAERMGSALGRLDTPFRFLMTNVLIRKALANDRPSLVDGRVAPGRWIPTSGRPPVKVEFAEGAFSHRELWTCDPAFDVAAATTSQDASDDLAARVRQRYELDTGDVIDPERWLLHRLVHIWDRHRHHESTRADVEVSNGAALWEFVAELLLDDLTERAVRSAGTTHPDGPWCGLDLDGVVETGVMGTSSPGRAGGLSLRSLIAHGYRPMLVTGRSLDDVARRSRRWRLAGGVAEYGAVLWTPEGAVDLRTEHQRDTVARLRTAAGLVGDVIVDEGYDHILRVRAATGRRVPDRGSGPLSAEQHDRLVNVLDDPHDVWSVVGDDQTDIIPAGIDKGTGVRAALRLLDPTVADRPRPLALAVGDSPTDRPLLDLGVLAFVPAHAAPETIGPNISATAGAYQQGLADAVGVRIGHDVGSCPTCRPIDGADRRPCLLLISVREAGSRGMVPRLVQLTRRGVTAGRRSR